MRKLVFILLGQGALMGAAFAACSVDGRSGDPGPVEVAEEAISSSVVFAIDPGDGGIPDEHCRLSSTLLASYTAGRQVRIQATNGGLSHLALCTVDGTAHGVADGGTLVYLNTEYADKRLGLTSGTVSGTVTNENGLGATRVAQPKTFPAVGTSLTSDGIKQNIYEYARYADAGVSVAYTAPHGRFEEWTELQVQLIADSDSTARNAVWAVRYATDGGSNLDHFHITATDIDFASFPDLGNIDGLNLPYAVSFHGFGTTGHSIQNDGGIVDAGGCSPGDAGLAGETGNYYVIVGGGEQEIFRRGVAETIEEFWREKQVLAGKRALWRLPLLDCTASTGDKGLRGSASANFVNRLAPGNAGVQLEQLTAVRTDATARDAVARAVKSIYDCLLDGDDEFIQVAITSPATATRSSTSTSYISPSDQCPHYVVGVAGRQSGPTLAFDAKPKDASCSNGARVYVSVYKKNGTRWERLGGGRRIFANVSGACQVVDDSGYTAVSGVTADATDYRVVARVMTNPTSGDGAPMDAEVSVTKTPGSP